MTVVGLVGAGTIAAAHLTAWLSLGVDVLVHSTDAGAARLVATYGGGEPVGSLTELLDRCEVADICTPTRSHPELVRAAAGAGRDILCEKPLALTAAEAHRLAADCASAGVRLFPAHVVRYFPEYDAMHRAVARGDIGDVAVQRFSRSGARPIRDWFYADAESGGVIMDQGIHDLDFARWNAGEVATVFARERRDPNQPGVRTFSVTLTHLGGAISQTSGTWAHPGSVFRTAFEVAGTAGVLSHDSRKHPALQVESAGTSAIGGGLLPPPPFGESPYLSQIREMYAAFRGGPEPRVRAADGVAAVAIAEAAVLSARSGQPVNPAVLG